MNEGIAPSTAPLGAAFSGDNGEFRRLVTRGALLELVTFGFYRFWLATNIRRHLWSNSSVAGDALEYTGTGRELLIGFLFALAILVPIYLAYFVIGIEAERWKAFASVPFGLFYYGFSQFAIFRARRYRLTRTLWRGVRFWMTGSGTAYALRAFGWTLLTVVTLGLAYPWRAAALERYKMGHTFYGDLPGRFEGEAWDFFMRGRWLWLAVAAPAIAFIWLAVAKLANYIFFLPPAALEAVVVLVVLIPFIYPAFKATEWKWWLQGLRLGDVRFDSDLARSALIFNYWKMIGAGLLVALAVGVPVVAIQTSFSRVFGIDMQSRHPSPAFIALFALSYLASILALGAVWRIYLVQRIWKIVVSSIGTESLGAADHVVAKGEAASAVGEGLAGSLDVAGF
jgi:uncharacterized membrane protein YjgN (DUF898 family)